MSYTVQQVVTQVQRRLPDMQTAELTTLVNQVHRDILSQVPELRMDTVSQSLVEGQGEYDISEQIYQVMDAEYVTATGVAVKLASTDLQTLNATVPAWREAAPGLPTQFYLSENQTTGNSEVIGLYPPPLSSTSGGYPILQMYVSELQASDLGLSDSCLVTLQSSQVYVEGVSYLAAFECRPQMAGAYKSAYEIELASAKAYVRSRNGDQLSPFMQNPRGGNYPQAAVKGNSR